MQRGEHRFSGGGACTVRLDRLYLDIPHPSVAEHFTEALSPLLEGFRAYMLNSAHYEIEEQARPLASKLFIPAPRGREARGASHFQVFPALSRGAKGLIFSTWMLH